jgi:CRP-like cAMP-binding protein
MSYRSARRRLLRSKVSRQDAEILVGRPLFRGLDDDALNLLLSEAWTQEFPRNTVLFLQGDPASRFFVVFEGWVKVFRQTEGGEESVIAVFTRGESFAEAAIFDRQVYPVSAAVVEDARLLVVPADSFLRHLSDNSSHALNMMASLSRHQHQLVRHVEQLSVRSTTERVAGFLARLCPEDARSATVRLPLDKTIIAGRLGMQPETFSRSLAKLRELGVRSARSEVTIPDVDALRRLGRVDPTDPVP